MYRSLLALTILYASSLAAAGFNSCYSNSDFHEIENLQPYIWKAAVYGTEEHRKTEEEFALATGEQLADVHKRFEATGTIDCGLGEEGSAQITVRNNIITTVAHTLWDPLTCRQKANATDCRLILPGLNGAKQEIKVKQVLSSGFKCPVLPTQNNDWLVMKLERPAEGVEPYQVENFPAKGLIKDQRVTFVAHSIDFQRKDARGNIVYPKHIQRGCNIQNVYRSGFDPSWYAADCDGGAYASGGSLLVETGRRPLLAGIMRGNMETKQQVLDELKGKKYMAPYNENAWSGGYVPVAGDFLRAILNAQ